MISTSSGRNQLEIKGIGEVNLKSKWDKIVLRDVLYVPDLSINLISLRRLLLNHYTVDFQSHMFSLLKDGKLAMKGYYINHIPCLHFSLPVSSISRSHLSYAENLHKSLGHVSYHRLRHNLNIPIKKTEDCKSCAISKFTRTSFHSRTSMANCVFQEIHLDTIGPLPTSRKGHKYLLTVVDAYS